LSPKRKRERKMTKVEIIYSAGGDIVNPLDCGLIADLVPYNNKISGASDPMIRYAHNRFIHVSTVRAKGWRVQDAETGEPISV